MQEPDTQEPNTQEPDMEELKLPTLPFPIAAPNTTNKNKDLRRSRKTQQADRKDVVGWAVEQVLTGQKWEFSEDTSWETFKKTVGLKEGLWLWYEVAGASRETIVSTEDEFDTMWKLATSSWASNREHVCIQLVILRISKKYPSPRGDWNLMIYFCNNP